VMLRLRQAWRITGVLAVLALGGMLAAQFVKHIEQNIALSHELARVQQDIHNLRERDAADEREILRLHTSEGVVPYIHERLRMVRPGQTLIYVVPAPSTSRQP
jgi:cell division protein FtsB